MRLLRFTGKGPRHLHVPAGVPRCGTVNVLSIQSHVAYGHAGNASAVFPLQRLGIEVWPVHTVQFSNHTGYGEWTGRVFDGQAVEEVVQGIADRGVLGRCDAVLSGYLGSADIGHAVTGAVARVRAANPDAVYCCDPVIGDVGRGVFVRPGIEEFLRDVAVPSADIITPNHFELDLEGDQKAITKATQVLRAQPDFKVVNVRQRRLELYLQDEAVNTSALAGALTTLADNRVTLVSIRSVGQQTEQAFLDLVEKEESRGFARIYRSEAA